MNCPTCGGKTSVIESRQSTPGIRRRRRCAAAHRSYTEEAFVEPPKRAYASCKSSAPIAGLPQVNEASPDWLKKIFAKL